MSGFYRRSLLTVAASLMMALPVGWAAGEQTTAPESMAPVPRAMQGVPCGKRTDVVRMLRQNFGEGPIGQGLAHSGAVAEVFISANGTWTIVATSPDGLTCMIGSGQSWQPVVAHDDTI